MSKSEREEAKPEGGNESRKRKAHREGKAGKEVWRRNGRAEKPRRGKEGQKGRTERILLCSVISQVSDCLCIHL